MKRRVLFVDDEPSVLASLQRMLRSERHAWEMVFLDHPCAALTQLLQEEYHTVVADFQMPVLDGLQLLSRLRNCDKTRDLPVIILTGHKDASIKRQALDLGATDLLNKPIRSEDLKARVASAIRLKLYHDELKNQNAILEQRIRSRTNQLEASRLDILWRLGKAAEYRDDQTGHHIVRVGYFSRAVSRAIGADREFADRIFLAAPLHDIGKIGIPDAVLKKPGQLTTDEWRVMKRHCEIGVDILRRQSILQWMLQDENLGELESSAESLDNPVLDLAATIALTHHEKWNGNGYPRGLSRDQIPLPGRIVAICDVFDALTSVRPYKPAFTEDQALAIIDENTGQFFDPAVFAGFVSCFDEILEMRRKLSGDFESVPSEPLRADTTVGDGQLTHIASV